MTPYPSQKARSRPALSPSAGSSDEVSVPIEANAAPSQADPKDARRHQRRAFFKTHTAYGDQAPPPRSAYPIQPIDTVPQHTLREEQTRLALQQALREEDPLMPYTQEDIEAATQSLSNHATKEYAGQHLSVSQHFYCEKFNVPHMRLGVESVEALHIFYKTVPILEPQLPLFESHALAAAVSVSHRLAPPN